MEGNIEEKDFFFKTEIWLMHYFAITDYID